MSIAIRGWLTLGVMTAWASVLAAPRVLAAEPHEEAMRLDQYVNASGEGYFMLSLPPLQARDTAGPREIVIVIDTSASQTGEFRDKALTAAETCVKSLAASDRVRILAADVDVVDLTKGFVAANDAAVESALGELRQRTPLGATDMPAMLSAVAASYEANNTAARAAVYIGDGKSLTNLLDGAELSKCVAELKQARVPLTSYAVGPDCDGQLLAVLANQTGGNLAVDEVLMNAADAGAFLAVSADAEVVWPTSLTLPEGVASVYDGQAPPLRSDRTTIVVGRGKVEGTSLHVEAATSAGALDWDVPVAAANEDNAYLEPLVALAARDNGLRLPTVGLDGLRATRQILQGDAQSLNRLAKQAAATGNVAQADQLAERALQLDPMNDEAAAVKRQVERARGAGPADHPRELLLANFQADDAVTGPEELPSPPAAEERFAEDGTFADQVVADRKVFEQYMRNLVRNSIDQARRAMTADPDASISALKLLMEDVNRATELEAEVRGQLQDQIEGALRSAERASQEKVQRDVERQAFEAAQRDRLLALNQIQLEQDKLDQLLARFDSLIDERRFGDAAVVGDTARDLAPTDPAAVAASISGEFARYFNEAVELRRQHDQMTLAALESVNVSAVPYNDQEPIIYPEREIWLRLTKAREKYKQVDLATRGPAEARIFSALEETSRASFQDQPLSDVLDYLKDQHNIPIVLDLKSMEEVNATPETTVTIDLQGISLKSILRHLLRPLELTYTVKDEVLVIMSETSVSDDLVTKVYPVADLVVPIQSIPFGGGGLGGGGFGGGGLGGGGGGFGGGGLGGGGGFGGGGGGFGGGGGGGFFNVRPERLPFRAFAVKDELRLKKGKSQTPASENPATSVAVIEKAAAPATAATPAPQPIEIIELTIAEGQDPAQAWNDYFAKHTPEPAAVRAKVREQMRSRRFDEAIAAIEAALRNQQTQPWMYEALGLAMQADERSTQEIERALLSAADFSQNPGELMHLAEYLRKAGFESRALSLYRQVSKIAPLRPEPYVDGLRVAQRLSDLDGIKWATAGILSQAWPVSQKNIWDMARRAARSTLDQLKAEDNSVGYAEYEQLLNDALIRDAVVVVSWTGDADVDLAVEEPAGSVCSFRTPRTPSGGIMLGDALRRGDQEKNAKLMEVYVCPQGFSGQYKAVIQRVWGKVAGGKVTVEVFKHFGTKEVKYESRQIELASEPAAVLFDVEQGRRRDALADAQLAGAVAGQLEVGRNILAQQLAALDDNELAQAVIAGRALQESGIGAAGGGANGGNDNPLFPFFARGAVGYMPVIIVLPQGANMQATAVISADRRYVRVSVSPIFSQITQVQTFNFATGNTGNSQVPGGGGLGGGGLGGGGLGGGGGGFGGGGGGGGFGGGGFGF